MKTKKLKDVCTDIFAGAALFTNDNLSRDYKNGGYRIIRLADIQNNEISFDNPVRLFELYKIKHGIRHIYKLCCCLFKTQKK